MQSRFMYVRKHRGPDGRLRLRAAHLPTTHEMSAEESDQHKAMKEFIARTCDTAGLAYNVEKTTKTRTSRPDVTVTGDGGLDLGCEAQYYNASSSTVLRRSHAHANAGLTANWITDNDTFHLVDRANWMLTRPATWRQIHSARDLPLMGGYRVLAHWKCTAAAERPCPDGLAKTGCGRTHLQWDTPRRLDDEGTGWTGWTGNRRGVTVGQTLIGAATGTVVPLFLSSEQKPRSGVHMWVPAKDRTTWLEYSTTEEAPTEEDTEPSDEIEFSGQEADLTCRFGEENWKPSAPLPRRGLANLSLTVDSPKQAEQTAETDTEATTNNPTYSPAEASLTPHTHPLPSIPIQPSGTTQRTEAWASLQQPSPAPAPVQPSPMQPPPSPPGSSSPVSVVPRQPRPDNRATEQLLDWRSSEHWSSEPLPCRYCTRSTNLRDENGAPAHKTCSETQTPHSR